MKLLIRNRTYHVRMELVSKGKTKKTKRTKQIVFMNLTNKKTRCWEATRFNGARNFFGFGKKIPIA